MNSLGYAMKLVSFRDIYIFKSYITKKFESKQNQAFLHLKSLKNYIMEDTAVYVKNITNARDMTI